MVARKPARGSHSRGEFFYYINWDFNVLGTIFEREIDLPLGDAFSQWIATPTGMTGFTPGDVVYSRDGNSDSPMYRFYIGADDLARFGALYASQGRWGYRHVVPARWVRESLAPRSEVSYGDEYDAYGYLWWLNTQNGHAYADGSGGQKMLVDRRRKMLRSRRIMQRLYERLRPDVGAPSADPRGVRSDGRRAVPADADKAAAAGARRQRSSPRCCGTGRRSGSSSAHLIPLEVGTPVHHDFFATRIVLHRPVLFGWADYGQERNQPPLLIPLACNASTVAAHLLT